MMANQHFFKIQDIVWIDNRKQVLNDYRIQVLWSCVGQLVLKWATMRGLYKIVTLNKIKISFPKSIVEQKKIVQKKLMLKISWDKRWSHPTKKIADWWTKNPFAKGIHGWVPSVSPGRTKNPEKKWFAVLNGRIYAPSWLDFVVTPLSIGPMPYIKQIMPFRAVAYKPEMGNPCHPCKGCWAHEIERGIRKPNTLKRV